jgi:hypothetical protein
VLRVSGHFRRKPVKPSKSPSKMFHSKITPKSPPQNKSKTLEYYYIVSSFWICPLKTKTLPWIIPIWVLPKIKYIIKFI